MDVKRIYGTHQPNVKNVRYAVVLTSLFLTGSQSPCPLLNKSTSQVASSCAKPRASAAKVIATVE